MSKSPEQEHPHKALAWAARDDSSNLSPYKFSTRDISADDIAIKIHYCGVCHSDYHTVKNDWKNTVYPIVPGHEIVGFATKVGRNVKKFKAGDRVGVGVLIGSCKECNNCKQDLENYCSK